MSQPEDIIGPIILWIDNGYDGWSPRSYPNMKEALLGERFGNEFVITRLVEFEVSETELKGKSNG